MRTTIDALLTGAIRSFTPDGDTSAIAKAPVDGPRRVTVLGIEGDEQADLAVHGGRDKAIHHYPRDHYAGWRDLLGNHPRLAAAGAFGENISTLGWTENDVCLGDRFRLGMRWSRSRKDDSHAGSRRITCPARPSLRRWSGPGALAGIIA